MPALQKCPNFEYVGVAHSGPGERLLAAGEAETDVLQRSAEKAERFRAAYGGAVFDSYSRMIESDSIDALYLPLPPALHFHWAKMALLHGKHLLIEKPAATSLKETQTLVDLARARQLALCENYMFQFHRQLGEIRAIVASGQIGSVRLIRIAFGFPLRGSDDFRYNSALGGGALLDCGGYALKLASILLGEDAYLADGALIRDERFPVDLYGNAVLRGGSGATAQIAFGMDNQYCCKLEIWGSLGSLTANRIFTAPPDYEVELLLEIGGRKETVTVQPDDHFYGSLQDFYRCVMNEEVRNSRAEQMLRQSALVSELQKKANER